MNVHEFEDCLDQFGSDLNRWPQQQRIDASELLNSNSNAKALLSAQEKLDGLLLEAFEVPEPYGLERKILERRARNRFDLRYWLQFIWKPAFAAALSLGFGFYLGAANQDFPEAIETDIANVTFYDFESWSGEEADGT